MSSIKCCVTRKAIIINKESFEEVYDVAEYMRLFTDIEGVDGFIRAMHVLAHQGLYINHMRTMDDNVLLKRLSNEWKTCFDLAMKHRPFGGSEQLIAVTELLGSTKFGNQSEVMLSGIKSVLGNLKGIYAMGYNVWAPLVEYRFNSRMSENIADAAMFQCRFNGEFIEMWGLIAPGGYRNDLSTLESQASGMVRYLSNFNFTRMDTRVAMTLLAHTAPILPGNATTVHEYCSARTNHQLNYIIRIMDYNTETHLQEHLVNITRDICNRYNLTAPEGCGVAKRESSEVVGSMESHVGVSELDSMLYSMFVSLEAAEEDLGDQGDDTSSDDEVDDSDAGGDDLEGGEGDDGAVADDSADDTSDTDDGTDEEGTDDASDDDTDDETGGDDTDSTDAEEEPSNMPDVDSSDDKGVAINIAENENLDSVLYRYRLENQIQERLTDKSLNNIQIAILKQLKVFWLHTWSIQSINDTLTLVEKLNKQ